ncbi:Uncharacterised protein [Legionella wadsworthii]|uniref:Uncharacterized protein n=1 Tax=Legionella wadsworthii TaxID=28088 RepID=A0A378LV74_9GAMM|nr:hypothetical protein [Legionella wadsworthii]STY29718.1 Uncharacterised protein [Legionella wadsworthii]
MIYFRNFMIIIFLFCSFSINAKVSEKNNRAFRSFWHPTYLGERLDYCTVDGKECGKAVADRYCQMLGYHYSSDNEIAYNIGLSHFISTSQSCKGWRCNGFITIVCATDLSHAPPKPYHYREKLFANPRFNDYRVDWCYEQNRGCGLQAANSFCSRMGFMQAKYFVKETQVSATKAIGSQELCFGNLCNGFQAIVCFR